MTTESGEPSVAIGSTKPAPFDLLGGNRAQCKKCGTFFELNSNSTLKNHSSKCCELARRVSFQGEASTGSNEVWNYNANTLLDQLSKFVIQQGLPFDYFDNPRLTRMVQETLQPLYRQVSRTALRRNCLKLWKMAKSDLILAFENLQTGVSLTTDVWFAPHGIPVSYLCVTAHWVDPNTWQMMKRTLAFELFGYPHTEEDLFEILDDVITTFKLENKIFSISFDNFSYNTNEVEKLKLKYKPVCDGVFFHSRCVAHIINLVVQDGLGIESVKDLKTTFRNMLCDVLRYSNDRYADYKKLCREMNSTCLGPNWDVPTRWNSTCDMFESGLRQRSTLELFHDNLVARGEAISFGGEGWVNAKEITELLDTFKSAMTKLSGVYYPTSCLVLQELFFMCDKLRDFENKNDMCKEMIRPMKEKLKQCFSQLPCVFTCAAALNPYLNVSGVEYLIDKLASYLGLNDDDTKQQFNQCFRNMFDTYQAKYVSKTQMHESMASGSSSGLSRNMNLDLYIIIRNAHIKRARGYTPRNEFERYIGTDYLDTVDNDEIKNFDILAWWKGREFEYPILSIMARDLLTVQASTKALESAFSVSGRVLSLRRTRLSPVAVETCICLKDHLDAVERIQNVSNLEDETRVEGKIEEEEDVDDDEDEDDEGDLSIN